MLDIGRFNTLRVTATLPGGLLLDAGEQGVLELDTDGTAVLQPGDEISVFIYLSGKGKLLATTRKPLVQEGEVAWLEVVDVNQVGAFADWGLPKDLFIPFAEQLYPLRKGARALVRVYIDNQGRLTGSTRLNRWIADEARGLTAGQSVSLLIADRTELGYKAIVDHSVWGLLYASELPQPLRRGQSLEGFVKALRKDGRVDLCLEKPGYSSAKIDAVAQDILDKLREHDGHLMLNDKSPPEAIRSVFGVSKRVFKQALGRLYKQRRVTLDARGMSLVKPA